jgi:hypothetical protein
VHFGLIPCAISLAPFIRGFLRCVDVHERRGKWELPKKHVIDLGGAGKTFDHLAQEYGASSAGPWRRAGVLEVARGEIAGRGRWLRRKKWQLIAARREQSKVVV